MALPFWLIAAGIFSSIIGMLVVLILVSICCKNTSGIADPSGLMFIETVLFWLLKFGWLVSSGIFLGCAAFVNYYLHFNDNIYYVIIIGHISRLLMALTSELTTAQMLNEKPKFIQVKGLESVIGIILKALVIGMSSR